MIWPLWRTVWKFLKKLCIELPCNPAIPLLRIHPEKNVVKENVMNKLIYKTQTGSQNEKINMVSKAEGWEGGKNGEFGYDIYTLLYLK